MKTKSGTSSNVAGERLLAVVLGSEVKVWMCAPSHRELGT